MPLHKSIPLCNFKYAGDTLSSATFKYDTVNKINKPQSKLLYIEEYYNIEKNNKVYNMYKDSKVIDKSRCKLLQTSIADIGISQGKELKSRENSFFNKEDSKNLISLSKSININSLKHLGKQYIGQLGIQHAQEYQIDGLRSVYVIELKELLNEELRGLIKNTALELGIDKSMAALSKSKSINLGSQFKMELIYNSNKSLISFDNINLNIHHSPSCYDYIRDKIISKNMSTKYFDRNNESLLSKKQSSYILYRYGDVYINKDSNLHYADRMGIASLDYHNPVNKLLYTLSTKHMGKYEYRESLDRLALEYMSKDNNKRGFYRYDLKFINKINVMNYVDRIALTPIYNSNNEQYLSRLSLTPIFSLHEKYLDRKAITHIFRGQEKYVKDLPLIKIYKQLEKLLLNITVTPIYKEYDRYLKGTLVKEIYLDNHIKYIDMTKRWWWLKETSSRDKLIVPNKDYAHMSDLLSNDNFEYLRYTNHPIGWGNSWGKDWSIPPYAVSIEIMLDLINIITMIWHKNTQGWLDVTGKEAIQLLMELLYDWYTMNTSSPNMSYKRAYRWIRWEAEKVYFLDTQNGLQAIGILVANLIDYMKSHHFNIVPIYQKPGAMDEERNFKKLANNGDLIEDLDKYRGNRHYLIETQNFEKKDIFRR